MGILEKISEIEAEVNVMKLTSFKCAISIYVSSVVKC